MEVVCSRTLSHIPPGFDRRGRGAAKRHCSRLATPQLSAAHRETHEPAFVQALITELPVEALDERILNRLMRDQIELRQHQRIRHISKRARRRDPGLAERSDALASQEIEVEAHYVRKNRTLILNDASRNDRERQNWKNGQRRSLQLLF